MIVLVTTAMRQYAVRHDDIFKMQVIATGHDLEQLGSPERPAMPFELGSLLGEHEPARPGRRHGLVVPVRRRPVVFLVTRVDSLLETPTVQPMPALIQRHIRDPWAIGVVEHAQELALLLDLRAIARSMLSNQPTQH